MTAAAAVSTDPARLESIDRFVDELKGRAPEEVEDLGVIPGDGLGAGGLDSSFWA